MSFLYGSLRPHNLLRVPMMYGRVSVANHLKSCGTRSRMVTSSSSSSPPPPPPPPPPPRSNDINKGKDLPDDIKYEVKFKNTDVKKIFKEFYSLYGPLFAACHIGISLISLGFFSGLVWVMVDPVEFMPEFLMNRVGQIVIKMNTGGKFVIAYAMHKLILPLRLGAAIWLTRSLSLKIKSGKIK